MTQPQETGSVKEISGPLGRVGKRQRRWVLALIAIALIAFAWHVRVVLNPLIAAYFLAFVLHPLVLRLQTYGWSRKRAVNTIFVIATLLIGSVGLGLGVQALHYTKTVSSEAWRLEQVQKFDEFLLRNQETVVRLRNLCGYPMTQDKPTSVGSLYLEVRNALVGSGGGYPMPHDGPSGVGSLDLEVRDALGSGGGEEAPGPSGAGNNSGNNWNNSGTTRMEFALSIFGSLLAMLGFLVLLPIYTYFLLFELERIHSFVRRYIPQAERERVSRVGGQIGEVIGAFFRGRLAICLAKGLFISAGLGLCGIDYALLLGMGSGALSLIPFAGPLLGYLAAFSLALQQPASASKEGLDLLQAFLRTGAVYGLAELFEGYYLTPKILGESLGLHPMVVLLSIFAGGAAFGMFGILLALPVMAALVILFRVFVLPAMARLADE